MRLFVAIALSDALTRELEQFIATLQRQNADVRWSAPESWHVTLQFLGNTSEEQYQCLLQSLRSVKAPAALVRLGALGFFDRVGIFHIAVEPTPPLLEIQKQVLAATTACDFEPEARPWTPHITLARNRGRSHGIRSLKAHADAAPQFSSFTAREFLLYESFLSPGGSRYEVRARFPLGAS